MKAVILAGGMGQRLRPITNVIPKPLLPIGKKAIIELQIEYLKKFQLEEIFVSTNYKADYISQFLGDGTRYGVKLDVYGEDRRLGTAGPIRLLEDKLSEPFLVINADIVTNLNLNDFYNYAVNRTEVMTVGVKKVEIPTSYGNVYSEDNRLVALYEKQNIVLSAMSDIYIMRPEVIEYIPKNTYYGMDQLIQELLNRNQRVATYEINEYWMDIGKYEDYEKVQKDYVKIKEDRNE